MNPDPTTLTEYEIAYNALKTENTQLKDRIADLEEIVARLKRKIPPDEPQSGGVTLQRFL
jgi:hypothetical protein